MTLIGIPPVAVLPKAPGRNLARGQWGALEQRGKLWAKFRCPKCGRMALVPPVAQILPDGRIDLELRCVYGCGMRGYYRLDGWTGGHAVKILIG